MATDLITASVERSFTIAAVDPVLETNGSSMIGRRRAAASVTARAVASSVGAVPASARLMRTSSLAKSKPESTIDAAE